jgi:hypothetical protein
LEDILADQENAQDWADKFIGIKDLGFKGKYAQVNHFKYSYQQDYADQTRDFRIEIDNPNLAGEKTVYTSPFYAPRASTKTIASMPIKFFDVWKRNDEGESESQSTGNYLIKENPENTTISIKHTEATFTNYTGWIPFTFHANDWAWNIGSYYKAFRDVLHNYKTTSIKVKLTTQDVANLDFFRLKYFAQTGRYYYLNSLSNSSDGFSTGEFLEVR